MRFLIFLAVLVSVTAVLATVWRGAFDWQAALVGFDVAAAIFLLSGIPLLDDKVTDIRQHAEENDANRVGLLGITVVLTLAILGAVGSIIKMSHKIATWEIGVVVATLALAWVFANVMFALHYAHLYYLREGRDEHGGLQIPGTEHPEYWDFLYFSLTLGMTFQTSDVTICGPQMRRIVLAQCVAAFLFNMGILAFTVNALGGM